MPFGVVPTTELLLSTQLRSGNMASQGKATRAKGLPGGKGKLLRYSSFHPGVKEIKGSSGQGMLLTGNNMKMRGSAKTNQTTEKSKKRADLAFQPKSAKDQQSKIKRNVSEDAKKRKAKFDAMIEGELADLPPKPKSAVRIFISSTFSDMHAERNTLARHVYPLLKEYCAGLDLDFQVVDMRWGVTEDSQNDHSVENLCLREISNCQNMSLGPNFVCILGDRYGFQLIPDKIESSEFKALLGEALFVDKDRGDLLAKWYRLDTNAVPHHHILQPIRSEYPFFGDRSPGNEEMSAKHWAAWSAVLDQLRQTLRIAAKSLHQKGQMSADRLQQFNWSVTECEINRGLMTAQDPKSHVLFFHRELAGLKDSVADDEAFKYIDCTKKGGEISVDAEAQKKLQAVATEEIPKVLGKSNCFYFSVPWRTGGVNSSKCSEHSTYIFNFCKLFTEKIIQLIDNAYEDRQDFIKSSEYYSEPDEIIHHLQFCVAKCESFCGRKDSLEAVKKYVLDQSSRKPLVIHAESGAGKTSLMAFIMKSLSKWFGKPYIGVIRFLGTSPGTINLYDVLLSVCGQLADATDIIMEPIGYQNFASLVQYMPRFLRRVATAAKMPIVILLDSVDQLSPANSAYTMKWLPLNLPANVRLIISTLPSEHNILSNMKKRIPENSCYLQVPVLQEMTVKEIVSKYLSSKQRSLTNDQLMILISKFQHDPCPLYLKLLLDKAASWHSYTQLSHMNLGDCARLAIHLLFESLEKKFGRILVQTALGFITVSLNGITEIEMEDALSCADYVLDDVYQFHDPPSDGIVRIPPLLWARIYDDLKEYLVDRLSQGKTTKYWYHRQFTEVATERYLTGQNGMLLHKKMLEIFLADSGVQRTIKLTKRNKTVINADRQVTHQPMIAKNRRKLECITHHLINAKSQVSLDTAKEQVFCNYDFLTTKITSFSVQHVVDEMDAFLIERPDKEIKAIRDFMNSSVADLRYPMHLAVHLLAGVASDDGCIFLDELLRRARYCVYNHKEPLLIPEGSCFAPRELSSTVVTHCMIGCKELIASNGTYVCTKEEGVDDGEEVSAVLNITNGEHEILDKFKHTDCLVPPLLTDSKLYMLTQSSLVYHNLNTGDSARIGINSGSTKDELYVSCVSSQEHGLVGLFRSNGIFYVWDLTLEECIEKLDLTEWSDVMNIGIDRSNLVVTGALKKCVDDQLGVILTKSLASGETEMVHTQYPLISNSLRTLHSSEYMIGLSQIEGKCCSVVVVGLTPLKVVRVMELQSNVKVMESFTSVHGSVVCVINAGGNADLYSLGTGENLISFNTEEGQLETVLAAQVTLDEVPAIVFGRKNGDITFHSLERGEQIRQVKAFDSSVKKILLQENSLVACAVNTQLKVWDLEKLLQLGGMLNIGCQKDNSVYEEMMATAVEISLCSQRLYTSTRGKDIKVWDISSGKLLACYPCGMIASYLKVCKGESELLVVLSKRSEIVKVLHSETGKEAIPNMPTNVLAVTLSKDKCTLYVITHNEGRLRLHEFELPRLRLARNFRLQKGLNFKTVAAILSWTERYIVLVVECTAEDRKSIEGQWKKGGFPPQPHPYRFSAIDLTHTSGTLLHCYRQLSKIPALGTAMVAHTGNTMIFCVRRCVCFWDIPTGRCDQMITKSGRHGMFYNPSWLGGGDNDATAYATTIVQSDDRNFVVLGSDDGYVTTYRAESGAPVGMKAPITKHHVPVTHLAVSSNSKWVVSTCQKNFLKLWDIRTGTEQFSLRLDAKVRQVSVSPDSQQLVLLTGTNTTRILLFRIFPGKEEA